MPIAHLTFSIELTGPENTAMYLVLAGWSERKIAEFIGVSEKKLRRVFAGMELHLNLVHATRKGQITWKLESLGVDSFPELLCKFRRYRPRNQNPPAAKGIKRRAGLDSVSAETEAYEPASFGRPRR